MKLVKITWRDSQLLNPSDGRFADPNEFRGLKLSTLELVGWLVSESPDCLVVAQEHDAETNEVKLIHLIPRESVLKIEKIGKEVRRWKK